MDTDADLQEKITTLTRKSRMSSLRRAPALILPNQRASYIPYEDLEESQEVVEDPHDDAVGEMENADAKETSEYLRKVVHRFKKRMLRLYSDGTNEGYINAYRGLAAVGINQSYNASIFSTNRLKNRFGNIMAYDHSRVRLPTLGDDEDSDYINANWIDGYGMKNAYIATQGPVPNSFFDFWRMVWEVKACTIVMVTHEVERGRMKCHRYWPDPTSNPPVQSLLYGDINVTHIDTVQHKHYFVRTFTLMREGHPGDERTVKQFAYTSWPDHGVPLTTAEMLGFRNAVNYATPNKEVPIVIHCSAGVGRTGTYIAIDTLVKQALDMHGDLDVDSVIRHLRSRRNYMVQTEVQYIFIYRAVLDCLAELLQGESKKAQQIRMDEEQQRVIQEAAAAAEEQKRKEIEVENLEIEKAKKELLARSEASAANAKAIITMSIQDRLKMLEEAEERWVEEYKKSLEEWNERNQFEAEQYDLTSSLTPVQSRLEALKQKGLLV